MCVQPEGRCVLVWYWLGRIEEIHVSKRVFIPLNPNLQQTIQSPIKHKAGLRSLITPMSTHRGKYAHTHTHTHK